MTTINKTLNDYLNGKRIAKEEFDDFSIVLQTVGFNKRVLDWFSFIHEFEVVGWRPKLVTQKLARMLSVSSEKKPIEFYALFCPSYKKGNGEHGFRTDDVGNTSRWGIASLKSIVEKTQALGISVKLPKAIFFDVALEQPDKTISEVADLKKNIENLKSHIPTGMVFELLSEKFPFVFDTVGYSGIKMSPLPVPQ